MGEITEPGGRRALVTPDGEDSLEHVGLDPFWSAFGRWAEDAAAGTG